MYECMEGVLKGDTEAEFTQQSNLVGSRTVGSFTMVIATMIMNIFPVLSYQDQKRHMYRYLRKPKTMKVRTFTTRIIQLNNYLPYFPQDFVGQMGTALPDDEVKEILYQENNLTRLQQPRQVYSRNVSFLWNCFEIKVKNLKTPTPPPVVRSQTRKKEKSKKRKLVSFEDSDGDSSDDKKFPSKKKLCQYDGKFFYGRTYYT